MSRLYCCNYVITSTHHTMTHFTVRIWAIWSDRICHAVKLSYSTSRMTGAASPWPRPGFNVPSLLCPHPSIKLHPLHFLSGVSCVSVDSTVTTFMTPAPKIKHPENLSQLLFFSFFFFWPFGDTRLWTQHWHIITILRVVVSANRCIFTKLRTDMSQH